MRLPALAVPLALMALLASSGRDLAAAGTANRLAANRAAARADARTLLARLRLPADVRELRHGPAIAKAVPGLIRPPDRYLYTDTGWWSTSAEPGTVINYLVAHRPRGALIQTTGASTGPATANSWRNIVFSWPEIGQRVWSRSLTVELVTPVHGPTVIVAQSTSSWIVPRPYSELVPRTVRDVTILLKIGTGPFGADHMRTRVYRVWRAARVSQLVDSFNRLPIVQPGQVIACTLMLARGPQLTLRFQNRSGGPAIALATLRVTPGTRGGSGSGGCDPIHFWMHGSAQTSLTSQTFVKQIGRLIGVSIS